MNDSQIILIGLLASAITWGLKILASYANWKPSRVTVNIFLYVISAIFAVAWSGAVLPSLPAFDSNIAAYVSALWQYLNSWIALATPILGSATLIYNLFYEKVALPLFNRFSK